MPVTIGEYGKSETIELTAVLSYYEGERPAAQGNDTIMYYLEADIAIGFDYRLGYASGTICCRIPSIIFS